MAKDGMSSTVTTVSKQTLTFTPSSESEEGKKICKLSFTRGKRVFRKTLANHIFPKYWPLITENGYFFCPERNCPVVYFNNDTGDYFGLDDLHTKVAHKMEIQTEDRPICYCKNVLERQIIDELLVKQCCDSIKDIQKFTEANTGKDCVITNPSGRCCGAQIKEVLEWAKDERLEIHPPLMEEAVSCCAKIEEHVEVPSES